MRVGDHTSEGVQFAGMEGDNTDERVGDFVAGQGNSEKDEEEGEEKSEWSSKAVATSRMPCRNKSSKKSAKAMKSSYIVRYVDAAKILTKMEITVCFFCIFVADDNCLLFEWKDFKIFAEKMRGLKQCNWVDNVIIDAWAAILNEREQVKSDESPLRLFAPLRCGTVVCPEKEIQSFKKQELFNLGMAMTLTTHKVVDLNKIQLYVFPVENEGCYFMICFDLRMKRTFIIDNTTDHKSIDMKVKYGNIPNDLTYMLSQYLTEIKSTSRAKMVEKSEPEIIILVWGNRSKVMDSGVYLMRHMETFKGDLMNWDTGFLKKGVKQIKLLRMQYCLSLVNFDDNKMKETVELEAVGHADENEVDSKDCVKELLDS